MLLAMPFNFVSQPIANAGHISVSNQTQDTTCHSLDTHKMTEFRVKSEIKRRFPLGGRPYTNSNFFSLINLMINLRKTSDNRVAQKVLSIAPHCYGSHGRMVMALDPRSRGLGFNSCSDGHMQKPWANFESSLPLST